ncbi:MAG: hypothetical protein ACI9FW_000556 [Flavobacterium sp.]|jgi:hypothetical protein
MNTEILNPKKRLLLESSLIVLHFETQEWLETIAFWKDETKFFMNLLNKKLIPDNDEKNISKVLENLDSLYSDLIKNLEIDIILHEKTLSKLEKGEKGISDKDYRIKHLQLMTRMDTFKNDFNKFKKTIFEFSKDLIK